MIFIPCRKAERKSSSAWPYRQVIEMLICHCKIVNDRKIRALIADGARTVGQVGRASGAGTCCGGCVPAIVDLIERNRPLPITTFIAESESYAVAAE